MKAQALADHYRTIHARLRNPPNAVPDPGINLKKSLPPEESKEEVAPIPLGEVIRNHPLYSPLNRTKLTFSSTLDFTAKEFGLTRQQIRAHVRTKDISFPRQVAMWIASNNKVQTSAGMGRYLDIDHTSVIHARKKISHLIETDATMRDRILSIEAKLLADFSKIAAKGSE